MPGLDGLEATRQITSDPRLRGTRVVVLTTFDLDEYVFGALKAGASGFLLKGGEPPVLIEAARTVPRGDALLGPGATRRLIEAYVNQQHADPDRSGNHPHVHVPRHRSHHRRRADHNRAGPQRPTVMNGVSVKVNGRELAFEIDGQGAAVLMVHGLGLTDPRGACSAEILA